MRHPPASPDQELLRLQSVDIPNPRVLDAIIRIMRCLLWFLDRTPKTPVDSRRAQRDDVTTLLGDIPSIITQEDDSEKDT